MFRTVTIVAALGLLAPLVASGHEPDSELAKPVRRPIQQQRPLIEVGFVLDTTGSMGGLLEGAKQKIWSIASRIGAGQPRPRLRVGLVAYRDKGDDYVTQVFDLTEDLDAVYENLRGFTADGGGDTPEHVGQGLGMAVSHLSWSKSPNAMKLIFVVGDAPPQHYQDQWSYTSWAKRAKQAGIVVNTVRCGGMIETETAFRQIASLADGTFVSIDQSGGMIATRTPYDDELARLNARLSGAVAYSGDARARRRSMEKLEATAEMSKEASADRMSYLAKAGKAPAPAAPAAGAVDLVAEPERLASVSDEDLPDDLRSLSPAERKAKLAKLSKERDKIAKEVVELSKKRDAWLAKNQPKDSDGFDAKVMSDIKTRAKKIGISY